MKTLLCIFIGIALIAVGNYEFGNEHQRFTPFPPQHLKEMSFGYDELLGDSLWLRLVQDIDKCDPNVKRDPNDRGCKKGWAFQMLDQITQLAPKFKMPYMHGGTILSVLLEDYDGANIIFDRGLKEFPNDWSLAYRAAYHYMLEQPNPEKAAALLVQAGKNGAPFWVFSLAGKLYSEAGKAALAKPILEAEIEQMGDRPEARRLKERLEQVNKVLSGKAPGLMPGEVND